MLCTWTRRQTRESLQLDRHLLQAAARISLLHQDRHVSLLQPDQHLLQPAARAGLLHLKPKKQGSRRMLRSRCSSPWFALIEPTRVQHSTSVASPPSLGDRPLNG
jgi:hypothetical protein